MNGTERGTRTAAPLRAFLATRPNDKAVSDAFATIDQIYANDAVDLPRVRAHLRRDMQAKAQKDTTAFCDALANVEHVLANVHKETQDVFTECDATLATMAVAMEGSSTVLAHAAVLEEQR